MTFVIPVETLILNAFYHSGKGMMSYWDLVSYKNDISSLLNEERKNESIRFELNSFEVANFCRFSRTFLCFDNRIVLLEAIDPVELALATNSYPDYLKDIFEKACPCNKYKEVNNNTKIRQKKSKTQVYL
jgi:hypothetical protein